MGGGGEWDQRKDMTPPPSERSFWVDHATMLIGLASKKLKASTTHDACDSSYLLLSFISIYA